MFFLAMARTNTRSRRWRFQFRRRIQTSSCSISQLSSNQCWSKSIFWIFQKQQILWFSQDEPNPTAQKAAVDDVKKTAETFRSLIDEKFHQQLVIRGERRLSHRACYGALIIMLYREQPRFQVRKKNKSNDRIWPFSCS